MRKCRVTCFDLWVFVCVYGFLWCQDRVSENIPLEEFKDIDGIVFMYTSHGNHFGFMEGSLLNAFSSDETYTYPAKVALTFFETVNKSCGGNGRDCKSLD